MKIVMKKRALFVVLAVLAGIALFEAARVEPGVTAAADWKISDHFNGEVFFNPAAPGEAPPPQGAEQRRGFSRWVWRWIFSDDWPRWPETAAVPAGPPPVARVPRGDVVVTPVGHATFLIQMDGLNILTDPILVGAVQPPVSWAAAALPAAGQPVRGPAGGRTPSTCPTTITTISMCPR
jgi:hypothetical protein